MAIFQTIVRRNHQKWPTLWLNFEDQKMTLNTHKRCFMGKTDGFKKNHLILKKWHDFEVGKLAILQRLKWGKIVKNDVLRGWTLKNENHTKNESQHRLICKRFSMGKMAQNTFNIHKMTRFWKVAELVNFAKATGSQNGLFWVSTLKCKKDIQKKLYNNITVWSFKLYSNIAPLGS